MVNAAYLRASTTGQDLATQRDAIERAARARGVKIDRWFEEKRSGRTLQRPVLTQIRGAAGRGELGSLFVFRIDRLTRSGVADTFRLIEELRAHGCNVVSVADGMPETAGAWGDVVMAVLAAVAQIELSAIRERIAAARARVAASGGTWGRRPRLSKQERALLLADADRYSVRQLAVKWKISRSTVQDALTRARLELEPEPELTKKTSARGREPRGVVAATKQGRAGTSRPKSRRRTRPVETQRRRSIARSA
jgi:DNA invertase Pin-like site-specific DNA recombinase